jgi:ATP-binding cassette subfamily G (WHITE) protein 2 (PDR)
MESGAHILQTFDKVIVLYEGRQIYFGPTNAARSYFERLGFECPASQTTPDYLTSMTSPSERRITAGYDNTTPRTSEDFARCWKESHERQKLLQDIKQYNQAHPLGGQDLEQFSHARTLEKSHKQRQKSPYTLSYWGQIKLCMWREMQRLKNDPSVPLTMIGINLLEALIIASIFYNLPGSTASFFSRGGVLFMMVSSSNHQKLPYDQRFCSKGANFHQRSCALSNLSKLCSYLNNIDEQVLLNAFGSILEIMSLYAKRTIIEKASPPTKFELRGRVADTGPA